MNRQDRFISNLQDGSVTSDYYVVPARPHHGRGVYEVICYANGFDPAEHITGVFGLDTWEAALSRFSQGQFVAVTNANARENVVGVALAMRTSYAPSRTPRSWRAMIGDLDLNQDDPKGRWLYGVEKAVHPECQGRGVGKALYKAQFDLVQRLNLRGMYAGGMLKGYGNYRDQMSVREYAARVMSGELFDPTISVQMRRGFKPRTLIENYVWDHECEHTGILIVWDNPRFKRSKPERSTLQAAL